MNVNTFSEIISSVKSPLAGFPQRLSEAMTTAQLTQADLSRKAGLAGATVSRLMRGHNVPDPETVEKIAKVTGVPFRYLFMGETEPASPLFENEGDLFRSVPMNRGFVGAGPAMLPTSDRKNLEKWAALLLVARGDSPSFVPTNIGSLKGQGIRHGNKLPHHLARGQRGSRRRGHRAA